MHSLHHAYHCHCQQSILRIYCKILVSEIFSQLPFGDFHHYWIAFAQLEVSYFTDALSGFFYPVLLLYLMPPLRQALKKSGSNATATSRVAPATQSTLQTSEQGNQS